MGASRKLQGEIDRVLKKVQEGVDVFDSIWNKVYDTDNVNQKEKFEADLKKEIKKLQRYRDQIKTWIQSSEIKDKKVSASYEQALVDARKTIEKEMERFKICEKETKTKAFSKEGLGQQPKTDPKEKAKSETRDWLNNVVGELESQIDSFEAEIEGLTVKKGKTRPPRLTHLEASITRHKLHIKKLELILRLLDNDELSPEQVNDVKDFLDDYVERNQEDFDDFSDVDDLYNSLPLDKVESLEDLVTIGPPGLVKGAPIHSLKTSLVTSAPQMPATVASTHHEGAVVQDQADDTTSQDSNSDIVARTPPAKSSMVGSSAASTPTGNHAPISVNVQAQTLPGLSAASPTLPGSTSVRGVLENAAPSNPSSPATLGNSMKEEEIAGFPGRRSSPSLADAGLARGIGRGGLSSQPSSSIPLSPVVIPSNGAHGSVPLASDIAKRNILGNDDRIGSAGMVQPLASPLSNRMILPQAGDGTSAVDTSSAGEAATMGGRVFSPLVTGMQWRPGSSFQNQNEPGQFRARTEIAPDQREKFLQRLQQVQQQGHSNILGMPPLTGGNHKQYSAQQNPLLQQFNSQSSSVSQASLGLGVQASGFNTVTSAALQQPNSIHQQSSQQVVMSSGAKDAELGHSTVDELQLKQNLPEDSTTESALTSGLGKSLVNEDELTSPYAMDTSAGASGSLTEPLQVPRDIDLSPGQLLQSSQPSSGLGVIGRRSVSELGAIGDNLTGSAVNSGAMHNQLYNLQMLEAAYHKLPQPKDSERARSYIPRHPAATPPSYPQVQLPMASNPAFWERLSMHSYGTGGFGFHDVVIENPVHSVQLSDMEPREIGEIFLAHKKRIQQIMSVQSIKYVQVFKNHGASAGASMSHSHSQILALPVIPSSVSARLEGMKEYFEKTGKCSLCEVRAKELLIDESSHFISVVPFAATFPFEIWIIPRVHSSHFHELDFEKMVDLGGLLKLMLRKISLQLNNPPFNFMIQTSPVQIKESESCYTHWFLQIVPQLSGVGGFEIGTGCYINPVFPEDAAKVMREVNLPMQD